jgi:hemolysin III
MCRPAQPPDGAAHCHDFSHYDAAETALDAIIHVAGVSLALVGTVWFLVAAHPAALSVWVYCICLVAMLSASAAYNMTRAGPLKAWLRRVDHAVIYALIAGTYTPLALASVGGAQGRLLCVIIWIAAAAGIGLKLGFPRRLEWLGFALYLAMGWLFIAFIGPIHAAMLDVSFMLLVGGGVLYTIGAFVHLMANLRFQNAIWHAFVLVAAASHFAAFAIEFVLPHG